MGRVLPLPLLLAALCLVPALARDPPPAQAMMARINALHDALFANFSNLLTFPALFAPEGSWLFPVGQPNATSVGRAAIHDMLLPWFKLQIGERSYMTSNMVAGRMGAYWWVDVYLHRNGDDLCMFTGQGFNAFLMDDANPTLIGQMYTWKDLPRSAMQNKKCGLAAFPFSVDPRMRTVFSVVSAFFTARDTAGLIDALADDAVWREPFGSALMSGKQNITTFLQVFNSSYDWSSTLAGGPSPYLIDDSGPLFSGNNVGFLHVVTFRRRQDGCMYSVTEFVSVSMDAATGLISDFDVFYDELSHKNAQAACVNNR